MEPVGFENALRGDVFNSNFRDNCCIRIFPNEPIASQPQGRVAKTTAARCRCHDDVGAEAILCDSIETNHADSNSGVESDKNLTAAIFQLFAIPCGVTWPGDDIHRAGASARLFVIAPQPEIAAVVGCGLTQI